VMPRKRKLDERLIRRLEHDLLDRNVRGAVSISRLIAEDMAAYEAAERNALDNMSGGVSNTETRKPSEPAFSDCATCDCNEYAGSRTCPEHPDGPPFTIDSGSEKPQDAS
jgi:hypothetical protein